MTSITLDVEAFHRGFGIPIASFPSIPPKDRVRLRQRLLDEEYTELEEAIAEQNLVEIADGIGDLIYILVGTALEYGIPLAKVWDEIHRSNMAKLVDGKPLTRSDGKVLKPEGWTPPDIVGILSAAGK